MNSRTSMKWVGGMAVALASGSLWLGGFRPFAGKVSEVPVVFDVRGISSEGVLKSRLTARHTSAEPLREVEILGYGEGGAIRVQRKANWAPGEELDLGLRSSWVSREGSDIEISAVGYRAKKHQL